MPDEAEKPPEKETFVLAEEDHDFFTPILRQPRGMLCAAEKGRILLPRLEEVDERLREKSQ